MIPLALLALATAGVAGYQYSKAKHKNKRQNTIMQTDTQNNESKMNKAQTIYNYNYLNDSNTGNTLFDSQQKTKRSLFGN